MRTKYYVYELTSGVQKALIVMFLMVVAIIVATFTGYLNPKVGFGACIGLSILESALLTGFKEEGHSVEIYGGD
jgi:hypothetical protein